MMKSTVFVVMIVIITAVSSAFRLERGVHLYKLRSEAMKHLLDHMVGPNAKNLVANFSRQMPISKMPGEPHELIGFFMPDFDYGLRSGLDLQQSPIFKLQGVSIGHGNRFRKVEKDILALIRCQANAAAMARVEIESEGACRVFFRPMSGRTMN
jgi:hypothetical protein